MEKQLNKLPTAQDGEVGRLIDVEVEKIEPSELAKTGDEIPTGSMSLVKYEPNRPERINQPEFDKKKFLLDAITDFYREKIGRRECLEVSSMEEFNAICKALETQFLNGDLSEAYVTYGQNDDEGYYGLWTVKPQYKQEMHNYVHATNLPIASFETVAVKNRDYVFHSIPGSGKEEFDRRTGKAITSLFAEVIKRRETILNEPYKIGSDTVKPEDISKSLAEENAKLIKGERPWRLGTYDEVLSVIMKNINSIPLVPYACSNGQVCENHGKHLVERLKPQKMSDFDEVVLILFKQVGDFVE